MESNSTAILIKIKLRHSLGRPSRSDFVQTDFMYSVLLNKKEKDVLPSYIEEGLKWLTE